MAVYGMERLPPTRPRCTLKRFWLSETPSTVSLRKEVIQPQVLLRLPCYDFTPIMDHTLGRCPPCGSACRLLVQSTFVDRKSTRLNSSHLVISYAVFCLKKKKIFHHSPGRGAACAVFQYVAATPRTVHSAQLGFAPHPRSGCGKVPRFSFLFFFFNNRATPKLSPLPQHDALPI